MGTGRSWKLGEKSFLPEELSSLVIRSIVEDAQNYLGEEIEEAVISVPAYFHDEQRVAVKRAGVLAGICVERIINEPSAAALASYFTANEEQNMLVFDFASGDDWDLWDEEDAQASEDEETDKEEFWKKEGDDHSWTS